MLSAFGMPGFTEEQADAQTQAQKQVMTDILDAHIATKGDVNRLEIQIRNDMHKLENQIAVLKWMMGVMLAGVLSLVLKAFFVS